MPVPFNAVPQHFEHALIVGGTGMLANATRFVRARSKRVTLVARKANAAAAALGISPADACPLDWSNTTAFAAELSARISAAPPDLALLWIHGNGHRTLLWLFDQLKMRPVLIVHVLGSASGDPRSSNRDINVIVTKAPKMHYVTVVLGSKAVPGGGHRWLTDDEISIGAIEAIRTGHNVLVGEIVPPLIDLVDSPGVRGESEGGDL
jgi:hypothetical protein